MINKYGLVDGGDSTKHKSIDRRVLPVAIRSRSLCSISNSSKLSGFILVLVTQVRLLDTDIDTYSQNSLPQLGVVISFKLQTKVSFPRQELQLHTWCVCNILVSIGVMLAHFANIRESNEIGFMC